MRKIYHLQTCNTCQRIIKELEIDESFTLQNLKDEPITPEQLDALHAHTGSYEALFNRRSRQFRGRGLHEQTLTEADYRTLILEEYTFLKRPVVVLEGEIFVGNSKKVVAAAQARWADLRG